ncbi:DUF2785 domain-containing protein [Inconstantimicrobium porci]|uniref:DUF2785 domain-containing protein n=1 Tax=Inconstantimicrobium porci TaxID=2652291 RepID=UPI00240A8BB1|nr:DUF2785 domain-containing protein [Inconstantimicrobium porci]MDD6771673.1 DUF2785 domain-containing protein [Inconstantimicrobium porci]
MNNEREELLKKLEEIKHNDYKEDDKKVIKETTDLMLKYIGDTDPHLRDELIYSTFCYWITEKCYFNSEELKEILNVILDKNHLFYKIGSEKEDSVVTRTFSMLVIDLLLYMNMQKQYLSLEEFNNLKDCVIRYYNEEKDLRGYEERIGWMHAAAHGADVLCSIVRSKQCDKETMLKVLDGLNHVLENTKYLLSHEEDERMATVVYEVVIRNVLGREKVCQWISRLGSVITPGYSDEKYIQRVNTKNFVRSLYFRLIREDNTTEYTDVLFKKEEELNNFLKYNKEIEEELEIL